MNPKIIIILPVHNRRAITQRFLECLNDQSYTNWHLILIDDGCTDGTAEMAQSLIKNITILKGNGNLWWAGSLQFAYRYIRKMRDFKDNDIVLIINDDVEISDVFIKNAVDIFMHNADRKILLQAIAYEKDGRKVYKTGVFYNHKHNCFNMTSDSKEINCFSTRGLFLRFDDFNKSGGFYPFFLPHYQSDYEFTYRLIKKGIMPVIDKKVFLKAFPDCSGMDSPSLELSPVNYIKTIFSKKNRSNPLCQISFVILTNNCRWIFVNIYRILIDSMHLLLRRFKRYEKK